MPNVTNAWSNDSLKESTDLIVGIYPNYFNASFYICQLGKMVLLVVHHCDFEEIVIAIFLLRKKFN